MKYRTQRRLEKKMSRIHKKTSSICPVCCDYIEDGGIILHKTRRQTHRLCVVCGTAYLIPLVQKALENLRQNIRYKITIVRCTGIYHGELRNQCSKTIDLLKIVLPTTIEMISSKMFDDLFRIRYTLASSIRFLCPNKECSSIVETHPDDPILHTECQKCRYVWCRGCQRAPYHEEMSCLEYEANECQTENGKYIQEKIEKEDMKYCPRCRTPTEKVRNDQGNFVACNKMICQMCTVKWCWLCQETGINYGHFNEKNATRCANKLWEGIS